MVSNGFQCIACGLCEADCRCDRYCVLCHSTYSVRLCEDGQYYCADCREICEFQVQT